MLGEAKCTLEQDTLLLYQCSYAGLGWEKYGQVGLSIVRSRIICCFLGLFAAGRGIPRWSSLEYLVAVHRAELSAVLLARQSSPPCRRARQSAALHPAESSAAVDTSCGKVR